MNNKVSSATKNIIMVCLSNGLTILVGLFMGFILPKNISVDSYANYQIYNLYSVCGVLSFWTCKRNIY